MTNASNNFLRWAPLGLLALALYLQGAKNVLAFAYWSLAALVFCWAALQHVKEKLSMPAVLGAGLFGASLLLSYFFSLDRSVSLFWTYQWIVFALLWVALQSNSRRGDHHRMPEILMGLALLSVAVTLYQHHIDPTGKRFALYGLLPVNYNFNALWLGSLAVFFLLRQWEIEDRRWQWAYGITSFLCFCCVGLGRSRGALVAMALGLAFGLRGKIRLKVALPMATAVMAGLLIWKGDWLYTRLRFHEDQAMRFDRLNLWKVAAKSSLDFPLTGYGPGNFELGYQRHAFPITEDAVHYSHTTSFAHNDYLQLAAEAGLPAAGLVIAGLFFLLIRNREGPDSTKAALITLLTAGLFNTLFKMPILAYFALLLASSLRPPPNEESVTWPARVHKRFRWGAQTVTIGLVALGFLLALRGSFQMHDRWDRLVRLWPSDASAWHALGLAQKNPRAAASYHAQAVQLSPAQLYYREAWGVSLEATGDRNAIPLALQNYLEASVLAPGRATNALAVGRLLYREGDALAALPWFEKAKALEPGYWEADLWRARCYYQTNRKAEAVALLEQLPTARDTYWRDHAILEREITPYEQIILGYSPEVVAKELTAFRQSLPKR